MKLVCQAASVIGLFASVTPSPLYDTYALLSVPAVVAGIVVTHLGLQTTFEASGSVVSGIALVVAFEAWRTRPVARGRQVAGCSPTRLSRFRPSS
jgi:hypothetical protein